MICINNNDYTNWGKGNCRVLTHLAKSQQNNDIDCNNIFISHEKILGKEADFFLNLRVKNVNRIIIGNVNVNSVSGKINHLELFVQGKIDILIIKLDSTFLTSQFMMNDYWEPYWFERNKNEFGILIYIPEDIPRKVLLDHELTHNIERIFLGLNLRKKNLSIFGSYYPPSRSDEYFFHLVKKGLNMYSKFGERYMLIWDFNE